MATAPSDFHHLEDYTRALGLRLEVDETGYDPTNVKVHLIRPSNKHQECMVSDYAMSLQEVVNVLEFLFEAGYLSENMPDETYLRRIEHLEERVKSLEIESGISVTQYNKISNDVMKARSEKYDELSERAEAIGQHLQCYDDGLIVYSRAIRFADISKGASSPRLFTVKDAFDPQRSHRAQRWRFHDDEMDELECFIARDEEIYYQFIGEKET